MLMDPISLSICNGPGASREVRSRGRMSVGQCTPGPFCLLKPRLPRQTLLFRKQRSPVAASKLLFSLTLGLLSPSAKSRPSPLSMDVRCRFRSQVCLASCVVLGMSLPSRNPSLFGIVMLTSEGHCESELRLQSEHVAESLAHSRCQLNVGFFSSWGATS